MTYYRHQLVAPLSEHQQRDQRLEREFQRQCQQQQLFQHLGGPARSDGLCQTK